MQRSNNRILLVISSKKLKDLNHTTEYVAYNFRIQFHIFLSLSSCRMLKLNAIKLSIKMVPLQLVLESNNWEKILQNPNSAMKSWMMQVSKMKIHNKQTALKSWKKVQWRCEGFFYCLIRIKTLLVLVPKLWFIKVGIFIKWIYFPATYCDNFPSPQFVLWVNCICTLGFLYVFPNDFAGYF